MTRSTNIRRRSTKINGFEYHVKCNGRRRPLVSFEDVPARVREQWFDYVDPRVDDTSLRFFEYRGEWYDSHEFEHAGHDMRALGFDGVQTESYFSAVVLRYFDRDGYEYDDEVVVGYVHW